MQRVIRRFIAAALVFAIAALAVRTNGGGTPLEVSETAIDFGDLLDLAQPVEHNITVRNRSRNPVRITVMTGCGCVSTKVNPPGGALPPGGVASVRVYLDPAKVNIGPSTYPIQVFADGQLAQEGSIRFRYFPQIVLTPHLVELGEMNAAGNATAEFRVDLASASASHPVAEPDGRSEIEWRKGDGNGLTWSGRIHVKPLQADRGVVTGKVRLLIPPPDPTVAISDHGRAAELGYRFTRRSAVTVMPTTVVLEREGGSWSGDQRVHLACSQGLEVKEIRVEPPVLSAVIRSGTEIELIPSAALIDLPRAGRIVIVTLKPEDAELEVGFILRER